MNQNYPLVKSLSTIYDFQGMWAPLSIERYAAFEHRVNRYHLRKHAGNWWRKVGPLPLYRPLLPYKRQDVNLVRKSFPPLCFPQHAVRPGQAHNSYLNVVVYDNLRQYGVGDLSRDARRLLRLGLRNRVVLQRPTNERRFVEEAYPVFLSFQKRSNYKVAKWRIHKEGFADWIRGLFEFPEVEILAAYHGGELVSFETSCRVGEEVHLLSMVHSDKGIRLRAPDLIQHHYRTAARGIPEIRLLYDGLLARDENVNLFKIRRGARILCLPALLHANLLGSWFLRLTFKTIRERLFGLSLGELNARL